MRYTGNTYLKFKLRVVFNPLGHCRLQYRNNDRVLANIICFIIVLLIGTALLSLYIFYYYNITIV